MPVSFLLGITKSAASARCGSRHICQGPASSQLPGGLQIQELHVGQTLALRHHASRPTPLPQTQIRLRAACPSELRRTSAQPAPALPGPAWRPCS
jgi:hypothetical protein